MMDARDSTASVIWLVMSLLTMAAVLVDTTIQSSSIPARVMAVVMMPMREASRLLIRNFIKISSAEKGFGNGPLCLPNDFPVCRAGVSPQRGGLLL